MTPDEDVQINKLRHAQALIEMLSDYIEGYIDELSCKETKWIHISKNRAGLKRVSLELSKIMARFRTGTL